MKLSGSLSPCVRALALAGCAAFLTPAFADLVPTLQLADTLHQPAGDAAPATQNPPPVTPVVETARPAVALPQPPASPQSAVANAVAPTPNQTPALSAAAPVRAAPSVARANVAAQAKRDESVSATAAQAPAAAAPVAAAPDSARVLQAALPDVVASNLPDETLFPHLPILKPAVAFWTQVFATWSENQTVVHSTEDLRKIFLILDFRDQAALLDPADLAALKTREEAAARRQVEETLRRVDALQATPEQMSPEELRIFKLYADNPDPHRFIAAIDTLRTQRGLRERTQRALATSGRYMPQMESIFASYNLPKLITRLPLMESSFNVAAYSKAGAAGVWQFIPSSARIYMRLNDTVDDRRDPWTSTDGAARHLKDDYDALRDWPLALTAYNFGRNGLVRGLAEVNGTSLTDLIQRYQSRRFGFASKNYYAEFLAVIDVERNWRKHFGDFPRDAPVPFDLVETRDYIRYDTLRRISGTDAETFRTLNPAYRDTVLNGKLYVPPANLIRVPLGMAEKFRVAYAALGPGERHERQKPQFQFHRVARGETVARIAARYGLSTRSLLAYNGLRSAGRVRRGQLLRIPVNTDDDEDDDSDDDAPKMVAAAESPSPAHVVKVSTRAVEEPKTHRVSSGQTLGSIARRYQTTVTLLRKLNHLSDEDDLRTGTLLKIPH